MLYIYIYIVAVIIRKMRKNRILVCVVSLLHHYVSIGDVFFLCLLASVKNIYDRVWKVQIPVSLNTHVKQTTHSVKSKTISPLIKALSISVSARSYRIIGQLLNNSCPERRKLYKQKKN